MKKSLTAAQVADIMAKLLTVADKPVEDIEFTAAELDYDVSIELPSMSAKPETSLMTAAAAAPCSGTRKISIRVPNTVLNAFQEQAKRKGTRGQTLINRVLKDASKGW